MNSYVSIKLRGGYRDGLELEIPSEMAVIDVPRIDLTLDRAQPITPNTIKHHSWDEDALTISYERYRRTDESAGGRTVYEFASQG